MGLRITTWNVNGVRNPFGYMPWREKKTFAAMFDTLQADIVIFQELKIQAKDLADDMVLVPGWDCFFSLPKSKKGYSGVAIYTRQSKCCPIKAEEGLTGILCPPGSSTTYRNLPEDRQIGGYPDILLDETPDEKGEVRLAFSELDSEGRCVILEFPAFVLIGLYCPATRDQSRDKFRLGFLEILDVRIRNLSKAGKRVIATGDFNIIRSELDTANPAEQQRKHKMTPEEYISTPSRRILNQLLFDGVIIGDKDKNRESPLLRDICRHFHPDRRGMYTCWEQKINARPGNFGSRIDYVLCSSDMIEWMEESDIQEGLMGSDHCPVYAVIKDSINLDGMPQNILDSMNPSGVFENGERLLPIESNPQLALSGRLIPEFDRRRNIRDMFSRKPSKILQQDSQSSAGEFAPASFKSLNNQLSAQETSEKSAAGDLSQIRPSEIESSIAQSGKRARQDHLQNQTTKRHKASVPLGKSKSPAKGQQTLKGFFSARPIKAPELPQIQDLVHSVQDSTHTQVSPTTGSQSKAQEGSSGEPDREVSRPEDSKSVEGQLDGQDEIHDPIVAKESWSKLLSGKRRPPRCESHDEPCVSFVTKKPGVNRGRSFYLCPRPVGPTGEKEKGTQWRCGTFIWSSEWNG